jgi:DNA-binding XRE family transcriptional regulator
VNVEVIDLKPLARPSEIRGARARLGYTQKFMADCLDISVETYRKKEIEDRFDDREKVILAKILELTPKQINDFFFDGELPISS